MTRLPVNRFISEPWDKRYYYQSVNYYPAVGALIAVVMMSTLFLMGSAVSSVLLAAVLLAVWVAITGALHIDGLADSVDAYFASHKDAERTLSVMKDPACGPMAVAAVVCALLLKFAALVQLLSISHNTAIFAVFMALVVARTAPLYVMQTTPYAREQGMATGLAMPSDRLVWLIVVLSLVLVVVVSSFVTAVLFAVGIVASCVWWRDLWQQKISGYTGDTLGALVEIIEVVVLVVLAIGLAGVAA